MAATKKHRKRASSKANTGARHHKRRKSNTVRHHRRRSNPGTFGSPMDWLSGGAGVLTGVVATRGLPQLIMASSNTGPMGYFLNAIAAAVTTFAAHMAFPRNRVFSGSVLAGGAAAIISRIVGDYSLLGSYSSQVGLGDYMFNFSYPVPQTLQPGNPRQLRAPGAMAGAMPMNMNSAAAAGVSGWGNLY